MPRNFEDGYNYHRDRVLKSFAELKDEFTKLETIITHGYASYTNETILNRLEKYEAASRHFLSDAHKYDYFMTDQSFEDREPDSEDNEQEEE